MYVILIISSLLGGLTTFIGVIFTLNTTYTMRTAEIVTKSGLCIFILSVFFLIMKIIKSYKKRTYELNTKKCLACGNIVNIKQNFCNKCGNLLEK